MTLSWDGSPPPPHSSCRKPRGTFERCVLWLGLCLSTHDSNHSESADWELEKQAATGGHLTLRLFVSCPGGKGCVLVMPM